MDQLGKCGLGLGVLPVLASRAWPRTCSCSRALQAKARFSVHRLAMFPGCPRRIDKTRGAQQDAIVAGTSLASAEAFLKNIYLRMNFKRWLLGLSGVQPINDQKKKQGLPEGAEAELLPVTLRGFHPCISQQGYAMVSRRRWLINNENLKRINDGLQMVQWNPSSTTAIEILGENEPDAQQAAISTQTAWTVNEAGTQTNTPEPGRASIATQTPTAIAPVDQPVGIPPLRISCGIQTTPEVSESQTVR